MNQIEKDIEIDKHDLEAEWVKQAGLFHHYLMERVEAEAGLNDARFNHDANVAELYKQARLTLPEKTTETAIKRSLETDNSYLDGIEAIKDWDYKIDVLGAAVRALEQKKTALENLVKLRGMDWFSAPSETGKGENEQAKALAGNPPRQKGGSGLKRTGGK